MVLVAVAGLMSDRMRLGLAADLECSRRDLGIAYRHAQNIALEEHARTGGLVPEDGPALAALLERLAPRVHEIVCDAAVGAWTVIAEHRRAWRLIAEALADRKHLDGDEIAAIIETDRRYA